MKEIDRVWEVHYVDKKLLEEDFIVETDFFQNFYIKGMVIFILFVKVLKVCSKVFFRVKKVSVVNINGIEETMVQKDVALI